MKKVIFVAVLSFTVGYMVNKIVDWYGVDQGIEVVVTLQVATFIALLSAIRCKTL